MSGRSATVWPAGSVQLFTFCKFARNFEIEVPVAVLLKIEVFREMKPCLQASSPRLVEGL